MKIHVLVLFILVCSVSCKTDTKKPDQNQQEASTLLEKVAMAHGYESWKDVKELHFTFNVDRDTAHFERSWIWKPKTGEVTGISMGDTVSYMQKAVDSTVMRVDAAFINDKYWLLAPFQLLWDKDNFNHTSSKAEAPIHAQTMHKLTIVYGNEGGYTPGDAYDFYFEDDYIIKEWVFRKGNQVEPSTNTTWEDYTKNNGLKLSHMHQNKDGGFKLYFSNVEVLLR